MSCDVGKATEGLENELWRRWSDGKVGEWVELILQPFCCFTYITAHSPIFPSLHLRHISFSNPSVALPTSQFILQHFRRFTYVTSHSPTLPSLYLRHSSFSNPSVSLPTSHLILQPFRCFIYATVHSPPILWLLLRHRLFTWRASRDIRSSLPIRLQALLRPARTANFGEIENGEATFFSHNLYMLHTAAK